MECVFYPPLTESTAEISLEGEEARHLKALRVRDGTNILISNGKGLCALAETIRKDKSIFQLKISEFKKNLGEIPFSLTLAMPVIDDRDRFEFALEKGVELGICTFIPFYGRRCGKKKVNTSRLEKKAVAALKQCNRSVLPEIIEPLSLNMLISQLKNYDYIVLGDFSGECDIPQIKKNQSVICIAGPEGGFTEEERDMLISLNNCTPLFLGDRILRSETASILLLSIVFFSSF